MITAPASALYRQTMAKTKTKGIHDADLPILSIFKALACKEYALVRALNYVDCSVKSKSVIKQFKTSNDVEEARPKQNVEAADMVTNV